VALDVREIEMNDKDNEARVIEAIDHDWAFTDQADCPEVYVLVSEDRTENEHFRPSKSLVMRMEEDGLIEFCSKRSDERGKEREYMDFLEEKIPIHFVYFFNVTKRGRERIKQKP
jgi:hypothetical protein